MSNYLMDGYHREIPAAEARTSERVAFIKRTYGLVALSFMAFVGILALLVQTGIGMDIAKALFASPVTLLVLLALFIGTGYLARYLARSESSPAVQLAGLALYVAVEALIFLPLILICSMVPKFNDIPMQAGILTLIVVGGLTATVFVSKKDFSFLGGILATLSWVALGVIVLAIITGGITLGIWFSAAMIALACGFILYDTSNVLHHYPTNAHVPAALELFASIAFLLFYVMRLMIQLASSSE
jgi:FtsH-binding integral membrane protein